MKKLIAVPVFLALFSAIAYAITVNPASMVTADSANTATTIAYRDTNGAFSAGIVTVSGLVNTGTLGLQVATTAQIALRADPAGTLILAEGFSLGTPITTGFALCASTAANVASYVYIATVTAVAAGTACR